MSQTRIPCMMIRGGTSKGAYFHSKDLPVDQNLLKEVLLTCMGSPDKRQIDGIGGADSLTSKIAIIKPSQKPEVDVDYLFAQVVVDSPTVDFGQNCGNILAGVGPFAIESGLVKVTGDVTEVRIFMENTGQIAVAKVKTPNGTVEYEGDTCIDGVPGTSSRIIIEFQDIAGSSCGSLLPTGKAKDVFGGIEVTCIDNGMPVILIKAEDLGCTGYESAEQLNANQELKKVIESIRIQAGQAMNLGDVTSRTVPKISLIAKPTNGGNICSRTFIPHRCHTAIGVFGAVSLASACLIPNSVTQGIAHVTDEERVRISVEHPTGEFTVELQQKNGVLLGCGLVRTARLLMSGDVYIPKRIWNGQS
ncbi:4-oxalomesaconate tautomerase [Azomonas agilis]|uniref:4-oxalomesaconate tautomerase n=1 Tax=Azomonas agilis TaxID=116849 RepID=A0A562IYA2_9GAMM|nr:4-oxalomesaconate tautomerase [Azomonas agilis]TWH75898.1 4-oxalomesaconate tautomerase [Azomonas agilis]